MGKLQGQKSFGQEYYIWARTQYFMTNSILFQSPIFYSMGNTPLFSFIHFNDVYDIQKVHRGSHGATNFQILVNKLRRSLSDPLLIFSGDAFSPSVLSNVQKGQQMVSVLNMLKVDVACMGNHQFDLQQAVTLKLFKQCNFPWLLGNILRISTNKTLGNGIPFLVKYIKDRKIGFFGVAGEDWIDILSEEYEDDLKYLQVNQYSKQICRMLKEEQECDLIVALTHMRNEQDRKLAAAVPEIDLILGGHDHVVLHELINGVVVIKSGDNFKRLSTIKVYEKGTYSAVNLQKGEYKGNKYDFGVELHEVGDEEQGLRARKCATDADGPQEQEISDLHELENVLMKEFVGKCWKDYKKFDKVIGYCDVPLNTSSKDIRRRETNYGNFVADLVRAHFNTDIGLVNSGCIRADTEKEKGELLYSFLSSIIDDLIVVKQLSGAVLLQALEHACSSIPESLGGNFLLVSGMRFIFDDRKSPKVQQVSIGGKALEPKKNYSVAINLFIANGGDGFDMLKPCKLLKDETKGINLLELLLKVFRIVDISPLSQQGQKNLFSLLMESQPKFSKGIWRLRNRFITLQDGTKYACISPILDGRVKNLADHDSFKTTIETEEGEQESAYAISS